MEWKTVLAAVLGTGFGSFLGTRVVFGLIGEMDQPMRKVLNVLVGVFGTLWTILVLSEILRG